MKAGTLRGALLVACAILVLAVAEAQASSTDKAPPPPPSAKPELTVYAAASLRNVLTDIAPTCESDAGVKLAFNFGGSNDLARQIVAANKADVFISADESWMNHVFEAKLVHESSRKDLLSNQLVVVGATDTKFAVASAEDLATLPLKAISLANPDAVPAGKYAKAWLTKAGAWERLQGRVVPSPDVRAAMALVENGAAEVGVVYRTDAAISKKVRVLHEVSEEESGVRITYPIAALLDRPYLEQSQRLIACLSGAKSRAVFETAGFIVLDGR